MQDERTKSELLAELQALRTDIDALSHGSLQPDEGGYSGSLGFAQSLTRFRELLRSLGAVMIEVDPDGTINGCSASSDELLGTPGEALAGRAFHELVHPDEKAAIESLVARAESAAPECFRFRHAGGGWRHFELQISPAGGLVDSPQRLVFARDVTEVHDAQVAIQASEDRYRALTENALDLIVEVDSSGQFLYVSPNSQELLGYAPDELVGRNIEGLIRAEHIHPEDRDLLLSGFQHRVGELGEGGERIYRVRHRDGSERWLESRARTYRTQEDDVHAVVVSRDITDLIDARRDLHEAEKRYTLLGDTSRDMITESDPDSVFVYISRSVRGLLGYEPEELLGTNGADLIHPDDRARVQKDFVRSPENPTAVFTPPYRVRLKDGSYRWFEGSGVAYTRPDGSGPFTIGLLRDVHERVSSERERQVLEERVQRSQRLEGLGVMAGGIAHDFNNLLTPILGQSSLALLDLDEDHPARERIEKVRNAARRAAKLTSQMLAYAGAGPLLFEATDLTELVREMGQLLESTVSGKAVVRFELQEGLAPIEADSAQLSQVVMNLISNAAEAVGDGDGSICVRTRTLFGNAVHKGDLVVGDVDSDLRYVCFEVEDTGVGMDAATRSRIFDPFFTTKFTGRGLGLAAVLGIVRGHDGAIELDTERGRGTRFRVLLPPRGSGESGVVESPSEGSWTSSGTVLVADDDEGVRDVAVDTLQRCGFDVLTARDGRQALELVERHTDEIRAVLLDRTMPVVSGEEAFATLRRERPYLPVIIVSGYSEDSISQSIADNRPDGFLKKPFLPEVLVDTLRKVLDD
jgi:PAS domain S-box-containing protein